MRAVRENTEPIKLSVVVETMPADLLTPLSVYLKLCGEGSSSFLLESVEGGESLARYSFIGVDPEFLAAGDGRSVKVGSSDLVDTSMFDFLRDHFASHRLDSDIDLPPFVGGAIGYFGFGCSGWFEPTLRRDRDGEPDACLMFFKSIVAFDHVKQVVKLVTLVTGADAQTRGAERNARIRHLLEHGPIVLPAAMTSNAAPAVSSNWTKENFETAVDEIKELIRAGECYQAVLSQCFSRPTFAHPVSIYRALRSVNPSPYMFLLQMPDRAIVGASPEMLVKCTDRRVEYRPIAGTRPRGKTAAEDNSLAEEMRIDSKEVAEHLMLVDLGRNDLGRVAEYGSVNVDELMIVEKYSHVQHLVSGLSASLRPELDRFDAFAACFPAGTVSGAPKVRATEIIQSLEPTQRGVYAGAVGYFDYGGNMDTCIAIRTLVLKDGIARVQAGAGIVADSVPDLEYQETVNKARALLKAIELAENNSL